MNHSADHLQVSLKLLPWQSLICLAAFCGLCSCHDDKQASWQDAVPPSATETRTPDRLNDDELIEGEVKLFEMTLPRKMTLTSRFAHSGKAEGFVDLNALTRYVGKRVESKKVELLPGRTVIRSARLKSHPEKVYHIEIMERYGKAQLSLRDQTPINAKPGLSEAERLKEAGFQSDGTLSPRQQWE